MDLVTALVETDAFRVAPPGEVFWYTSGTVGPYYVNTHFLYGSETDARDLLAFIDDEAEDRGTFPERLRARVLTQYEEHATFRAVADAMAETVRNAEVDDVQLVSGGQRRDWFFSPILAELLGRPHLLIYKDLSAVLHRGAEVDTEVDRLDGQRVIHAADLVTEASSYVRAWLPALRDRGAEMAHAVNVVDRHQGGMQVIADAGVPATALLRIDADLFDRLRDDRVIDAQQHDLLTAYAADPGGSMGGWLREHPDFLRTALASDDDRTRARAELLLDHDPYGFDPAFVAGLR